VKFFWPVLAFALGCIAGGAAWMAFGFWCMLPALALLAAFMVAGVAATPLDDPEAPLVLVSGMLGAAAMGVQNAAGKLQFGRIAPTTVMTGNVTELLIDMTDLAGGRATPAVKARFVKFFWPVLAFALGCVAGGIAYVTFGFWCLLPALALLAFLVLLDWPALEAAPAAA
jgi:uncharacterized membrane protein YoaK (UPF0700 family)